MPHSRFRAEPRAERNRLEIQTHARIKILGVARDAGVRTITGLGAGRFLVTRTDGSTFVVRVVAGNTNGVIATLRVTGPGQVEITVSARVSAGIVERAMANAVAQASAILRGNVATDNVLDWQQHPGGRTTRSAEDHGREAEVRNLERARQETARVRVLRRRRLAAEMRALVEELGMHSDSPAGRQLQAVSAVGDLVGHVAPPFSRRPDWALPPDGYPTWKAFSLHLVAELMPGLGAATVIALTGAPLVAAGVAVMTVGTAVSGTLIKRWYGRRDKTLVDTGHGVAITKRAYETALRRKQLLDPLLARARATGVPVGPGPAEPAPLVDYPAKYQSYGARLLQRGAPMLIGAGAASLLMFAGLPFWNAATHWGVAAFAAVGGPIMERYLRSSVVSREWALLDNVGRAMDRTAAEFDRQFVTALHALMDRIDALAGVTDTQVMPTQSPVAPHPLNTTGLHRFVANQAPGAAGDFARGATDAASKAEAAQPGAAAAALNAYHVGEFRAVLGMVINGFLDRQFLNAEYGEILTQVEHDFGNKMAEQVALEHRMLLAVLADLHTKVDAAEASLYRVRVSAPSRAAHLQAPPALQTDRPRGHQRWQAFARLSALQAAGLESVMVAANYLFDQNGIGVLVVGGAAGMIASTFALRYLFRRSEQLAVDETIFADRAKERVVEQAEAAARQKFFAKFLTRELVAATESKPSPPPPPPKVRLDPSDPHFPDHVETVTTHERGRLLHEPRPWSLLGPRLVGLDRIDRLVARVRDLTRHEFATGDSRPLRQARIDLSKTWAAYQKMLADGTLMPADPELVPTIRRNSPESGDRWHWVYPSPIRVGTAWPHYGDVRIGDLRDVDPGEGLPDPLPPPGTGNPNDHPPGPPDGGPGHEPDGHDGPGGPGDGPGGPSDGPDSHDGPAGPGDGPGGPGDEPGGPGGHDGPGAPGNGPGRPGDEPGGPGGGPGDGPGGRPGGDGPGGGPGGEPENGPGGDEPGDDPGGAPDDGPGHDPGDEPGDGSGDGPGGGSGPGPGGGSGDSPGSNGPGEGSGNGSGDSGSGGGVHGGGAGDGSGHHSDGGGAGPGGEGGGPGGGGGEPGGGGGEPGGGGGEPGGGSSGGSAGGDCGGSEDDDSLGDGGDGGAGGEQGGCTCGESGGDGCPDHGSGELPAGEPLYVGQDRLWPDELADIVAQNPEWDGGPVRLVVVGGHVDGHFVERLQALLGVDVDTAPGSVVDGFPRCSTGTVMVFSAAEAGSVRSELPSDAP